MELVVWGRNRNGANHNIRQQACLDSQKRHSLKPPNPRLDIKMADQIVTLKLLSRRIYQLQKNPKSQQKIRHRPDETKSGPS